MPWKFKYSENTHKSYHSQDGQRHGLVSTFVLRGNWRLGQLYLFILLGHHSRQGDKVWNDRDYIDNVHDVAKKVQLVGTGEESDRQLEREPNDADGLDQEEGVGDVWHLVLLDLCAVRRSIKYFVVLELGQSL